MAQFTFLAFKLIAKESTQQVEKLHGYSIDNATSIDSMLGIKVEEQKFLQLKNGPIYIPSLQINCKGVNPAGRKT